MLAAVLCFSTCLFPATSPTSTCDQLFTFSSCLHASVILLRFHLVCSCCSPLRSLLCALVTCLILTLIQIHFCGEQFYLCFSFSLSFCSHYFIYLLLLYLLLAGQERTTIAWIWGWWRQRYSAASTAGSTESMLTSCITVVQQRCCDRHLQSVEDCWEAAI